MHDDYQVEDDLKVLIVEVKITSKTFKIFYKPKYFLTQFFAKSKNIFVKKIYLLLNRKKTRY